MLIPAPLQNSHFTPCTPLLPEEFDEELPDEEPPDELEELLDEEPPDELDELLDEEPLAPPYRLL